MSGRQISWCACAASSALRVAAYVLTLKNTVPIDWHAACPPVDPRRAATRSTAGAREPPPAASVGALIAWKNWRYPALGEEDRPGEERHRVGGRADRARHRRAPHRARTGTNRSRTTARSTTRSRAAATTDCRVGSSRRLCGGVATTIPDASRRPADTPRASRTVRVARGPRPSNLGDVDRCPRLRVHGAQSDRVPTYAPRMTIETERLVLRELEPGDLDDLAAMFADEEVMRWIGGRRRPRTRRRGRHDRAPTAATTLERGWGQWATVERASGRMIGVCGLILWPSIGGREELEVAYLLARTDWGKGFATEAAHGDPRVRPSRSGQISSR